MTNEASAVDDQNLGIDFGFAFHILTCQKEGRREGGREKGAEGGRERNFLRTFALSAVRTSESLEAMINRHVSFEYLPWHRD